MMKSRALALARASRRLCAALHSAVPASVADPATSQPPPVEGAHRLRRMDALLGKMVPPTKLQGALRLPEKPEEGLLRQQLSEALDRAESAESDAEHRLALGAVAASPAEALPDFLASQEGKAVLLRLCGAVKRAVPAHPREVLSAEEWDALLALFRLVALCPRLPFVEGWTEDALVGLSEVCWAEEAGLAPAQLCRLAETSVSLAAALTDDTKHLAKLRRVGALSATSVAWQLVRALCWERSRRDLSLAHFGVLASVLNRSRALCAAEKDARRVSTAPLLLLAKERLLDALKSRHGSTAQRTAVLESVFSVLFASFTDSDLNQRRTRMNSDEKWHRAYSEALVGAVEEESLETAALCRLLVNVRLLPTPTLGAEEAGRVVGLVGQSLRLPDEAAPGGFALEHRELRSFAFWLEQRGDVGLCRSAAGTAEDLLRRLLDTAEHDASEYPERSVEALAALAALGARDLCALVDAADLADALQAFLDDFSRPDFLHPLFYKTRMRLYELDSWLGLMGGREAPRLRPEAWDHLGFPQDPEAANKFLFRQSRFKYRLDFANYDSVKDFEEEQKWRRLITEPLPFSVRRAVLWHKETDEEISGALVPLLGRVPDDLSSLRVPDGVERRIYLPIHEWEVVPVEGGAQAGQRRGLKLPAQQMVDCLKDLGYQVLAYGETDMRNEKRSQKSDRSQRPRRWRESRDERYKWKDNANK